MPLALISSSASVAPRRPCCPEYDMAPETGCRMPTLMGAPCARSTAGAASVAAAPSAVDVRKWRRFNGNWDIGLLPGNSAATLTPHRTGFYPALWAVIAAGLRLVLRLDFGQVRVV